MLKVLKSLFRRTTVKIAALQLHVNITNAQIKEAINELEKEGKIKDINRAKEIILEVQKRKQEKKQKIQYMLIRRMLLKSLEDRRKEKHKASSPISWR